jgi:hypothetical protein
MELPVVIRVPDAAVHALVGPLDAPIVSPLGVPGGELFARVADPLHPPVLAPAGYLLHMVIKLSTEDMVEVGLPQFCLVNDIARRLNGEAFGNPVRQPLGIFRLQLG